NFAARKVLGNHVWQNGSNLKEEFGTLDITHYENLTKDEIFEIEKVVNEQIFENKKVKIEEIDRTKAEKKYGFILYQGGAIPMKTLRVVHVEDSDIEACGGIHMDTTAGIGLVKIVETSKIQDGVVRLKFVVRDFALQEIKSQTDILENIAKVYGVQKSQIEKTAEKFFNEWKSQKKEIDDLKKQLKNSYISQIENSQETEFDLKADFDMGFVMEIFTSVINQKEIFALKSQKYIIATSEFKIEAKKAIDKGKFKIHIL
ncbi:MAG: alanine--tRNA ligase, partial [Nanoarchaeota archaeon]